MTNALRNRNFRRAVLAAPFLLALAACGSLLGPSNPPGQIYVLSPAFAPVDAPTVTWGLSIARPDAVDIYDTQRVTIERNGVLDYYADAQWPDQTEPLIERALVDGFQKSGHITSVGRERDGLHSDYLLQIEVRKFLAHYDGDDGVPTVDVELLAKLITANRHVVVSTFDAHQQVAATANTIPAAVAAFNAATGQVVDQIVAWGLNAGQSNTQGADKPSAAPALRRHHHG